MRPGKAGVLVTAFLGRGAKWVSGTVQRGSSWGSRPFVFSILIVVPLLATCNPQLEADVLVDSLSPLITIGPKSFSVFSATGQSLFAAAGLAQDHRLFRQEIRPVQRRQ